LTAGRQTFRLAQEHVHTFYLRTVIIEAGAKAEADDASKKDRAAAVFIFTRLNRREDDAVLERRCPLRREQGRRAGGPREADVSHKRTKRTEDGRSRSVVIQVGKEWGIGNLQHSQ
jgi:hypothetical protein